MDCQLISPELVAYHFGQVEGPTRANIERHLTTCGACLGAFLALKRELETAEAAPRPSSAARTRLRRAVAREVGAGRGIRSPAWWRRPLGFGFAAAACAAGILAVVSVRGQLNTLADLARPAPASLHPPAQVR